MSIKMEETQIRLPWRMVCRMACLAYIEGVSLNTYINTVLRQYIQEQQK